MSSTSSRQRGGRASSSSASKSSKKVVGKIEKYSSKYLQPILLDLAKSVVNENPKNHVADAWSRKMVKNILRNVSEASKTVFAGPEHDENDLQARIDELQRTIDGQYQRLKENGSSRNGLSIQPSAPAERAYTSGQYESRVQSVQDKVARLSKELAAARSSADERLGEIEETVDVVRNGVDPLIERAKHALQASANNLNNHNLNNQSTHHLNNSDNYGSQSHQPPPLPSSRVAPLPSNSNATNAISNNSNNTPNHGGVKKRSLGVMGNKQDPLQKMVDHLGPR